jgi:hypothetical protein
MSWRPAVREDRQIAALWATCAISFLVLRPLWDAYAAILPRCLWHARTGWPCPGCGTTRAVLALLHARPWAAFASNPLAAGGVLLFVVVGIAAPLWLAAGGLLPVVESRPRPLWIAGGAVVMIANWAWLCASGV